MSDTEQRKFTAADVRHTTGLSYRQLNEWDQRGALPVGRDGDTSWRKFSPKAMFAILVCSELRKRFNVPLESLKWLKDFMMQDGADHFSAAARMMSYGLNVLLITDFKETFQMDSDVEIGDLFYLGMTRHEEPEAFVIVKVNPLVNRILACLKEPIQLKIKDDLYKVIYHSRRGVTLQSQEEESVLKLLRSGSYSKVVIQLADGKIVRTDAESEHGSLTSEELVKLMEEADFQTVTLTKQSGKVVRVTRLKPNVTGRKRARREPPERSSPDGQ